MMIEDFAISVHIKYSIYTDSAVARLPVINVIVPCTMHHNNIMYVECNVKCFSAAAGNSSPHGH